MIVVKKRYPLQALADIIGADLPSLSRTLGISGSTWKEYRDRGVSAKVADRLAVRVGRHPGEVWPEYLDDQIAELEQAEAEKKQRRRAQQAASARRRYAEDPEVRERVKARARDYRRSIDDGRRQRDPKVKASKLAHLRRVRSTPEGRAAYNAYMREWKRRKREAA